MRRLASVEVDRLANDGQREYDGNNRLVHKYVYGPGVDQPVCMIKPVPDSIRDRDSNAAYYYHFDGLGSRLALSDADGNTAVVYEYDVYGRVAASDPNHPNPFLFTARRFDTETGLYYYRARYYNPYIGRFLQTDPIGYGAGMNWYGYCANSPLNGLDPSGRETIYVLWEYVCGLSFFYELTDDLHRYTDQVESWNLGEIAHWLGIDPDRFVAATFPGYGSGYVVQGNSDGYTDPSPWFPGSWEQIWDAGLIEYEAVATLCAPPDPCDPCTPKWKRYVAAGATVVGAGVGTAVAPEITAGVLVGGFLISTVTGDGGVQERPPQPPREYRYDETGHHYFKGLRRRVEGPHWHYRDYNWDGHKWHHGNWEDGGPGEPPAGPRVPSIPPRRRRRK